MRYTWLVRCYDPIEDELDIRFDVVAADQTAIAAAKVLSL
jgi:hypothetical protein